MKSPGKTCVALLPLLLASLATESLAASDYQRENERKQYEYEQGQRDKQVQSQRDYLRKSEEERGNLSETEKALRAEEEESRVKAAADARKAAEQRESAARKAAQDAIDNAAYARRKAAEDAAARERRAARLGYLSASKATPSSEAELCRIRLGLHPDFSYTASDVAPLTEPAAAQAAVAEAYANANP